LGVSRPTIARWKPDAKVLDEVPDDPVLVNDEIMSERRFLREG